LATPSQDEDFDARWATRLARAAARDRKVGRRPGLVVPLAAIVAASHACMLMIP
jgi:hypothetical protein